MRIEFAINSDIGQRRKQNQDRAAAYPELGLYLVADGMGGHQGGETASQMAIDKIFEYIKNSKSKREHDPGKTLTLAMKNANRSIYDHADKNTSLRGMGTTVTALLFSDKQLHIGQVGDSRCYYIHRENIWPLTRDHSVVEEKLRAGLITREQLKTDEFRNVITRSVGFEPMVNVDIYEMTIKPHDHFLICSDGLSGPLEESQILDILIHHETPKKAVKALVSAANVKGGDDNITALMIRILDA